MATIDELVKPENKFMFRGKRYKFLSYFLTPSIEMILDDGDKFSFGVNAPIRDEFILSSHNSVFYASDVFAVNI